MTSVQCSIMSIFYIQELFIQHYIHLSNSLCKESYHNHYGGLFLYRLHLLSWLTPTLLKREVVSYTSFTDHYVVKCIITFKNLNLYLSYSKCTFLLNGTQKCISCHVQQYFSIPKSTLNSQEQYYF